MGDFNIDLLKSETSQISHDFLTSLQSCYLIPTVDKPTRVHRNSATMEDKNPWNGYGKPAFHILNLLKCSDVA